MISADLEKKFFQQLKDDKNFRVKLEECSNPEQAHDVVKKAGYDVTLDDFTKKMTELDNFINDNKDELSDNDLENVAGGRGDIENALISGAMGGAFAGAAAAGAA